jgi:hypothetical protein
MNVVPDRARLLCSHYGSGYGVGDVFGHDSGERWMVSYVSKLVVQSILDRDKRSFSRSACGRAVSRFCGRQDSG